MSIMLRKTVYVLGAGASEGAGFPLMSNFLKKAEELREKREEYLFSWEDVPGRDSRRLVTFLKRYSGTSWVNHSKIERIDNNTIKVYDKKKYILLKLNGRKVEINFKSGGTIKLVAKKENNRINIYRIRLFDDVWDYLDTHKLRKQFNIEEILGYLDMKISINDSQSNEENQMKHRLLEFIEDVIILSYYYGDKNKVSEYSILLKKFVENIGENDTIISFNYDVLIDKFLTDSKKYPDYGIDLEGYKQPSEFERIPLLKLHGSLNWRICPKCKKPRWIETDNLLKMADENETINIANELFFNVVNICPNHKGFTIEDTFFVPPSWNKTDYLYNKDLWKLASTELKNANKIIFIGYSLPQNDIYFRYLLLSSLPENVSVEVVDPNVENTAGRYLELFKDNILFRAMSFEEYIRHNHYLKDTGRTPS